MHCAIDAIDTQTEIAESIIQQEPDYGLTVKEYQPHLLEDIELLFRVAEQNDYSMADYTFGETLNKGHSRIEKRQYWIVVGEEGLQFLRGRGVYIYSSPPLTSLLLSNIDAYEAQFQRLDFRQTPHTLHTVAAIFRSLF